MIMGNNAIEVTCVYVRRVNRMSGANRVCPRATCELRVICKLRVPTCDVRIACDMQIACDYIRSVNRM